MTKIERQTLRKQIDIIMTVSLTIRRARYDIDFAPKSSDDLDDNEVTRQLLLNLPELR